MINTPQVFFARAMLGCLFTLGGFNNILQWRYTVRLLAQKLRNLVGFETPPALHAAMLAGAVVLQLACSTLFILGIEAELNAKLLLAWLAAVTLVMHDFWTVGWNDGPAPATLVLPALSAAPSAWPCQALPTFPTQFDSEFVHFFKNVGMGGGLALFLAMSGSDGAGPQ